MTPGVGRLARLQVLARTFGPTTGPHLRVLGLGGGEDRVRTEPRVAKGRSREVTYEQDIAALIKHSLERSGDAQVELAYTGDAALRAARELSPDVVILDLNLPVINGVDVCRVLRERPETIDAGIIILTARGGETDRVAGLELGADDYITKPFSLRELGARVRAVLRRCTVAFTFPTR